MGLSFSFISILMLYTTLIDYLLDSCTGTLGMHVNHDNWVKLRIKLVESILWVWFSIVKTSYKLVECLETL